MLNVLQKKRHNICHDIELKRQKCYCGNETVNVSKVFFSQQTKITKIIHQLTNKTIVE